MKDEKQLECITNIIITRVWAAREIIDMGARETNCNHMGDLLNMAMEEIDELIYWMQQIRNVNNRTASLMPGTRQEEMPIPVVESKGDYHALR